MMCAYILYKLSTIVQTLWQNIYVFINRYTNLNKSCWEYCRKILRVKCSHSNNNVEFDSFNKIFSMIKLSD